MSELQKRQTKRILILNFQQILGSIPNYKILKAMEVTGILSLKVYSILNCIYITMSISFLAYPRDESERLMGDVVRLLGLMLGTLWYSELSEELLSFRASVQRPKSFSDTMLKVVIANLKKMWIISLREGMRATSKDSVADVLVTLNDLPDLLKALEADSDVRQYKRISSL